MKSAPSIAFDYRPAAAIVALASVIIVAAVSAPWFSATPLSIKAAVSIAAAAYGIVALRRFVRIGVVRIAYRATGWVLVDKTGTERAADLASHARYGRWIALDFRLDGRRRFRALIGPGNTDAETRRSLILLLSRAEVVQPA
jgi:toxin CptA